MSTSDAGQSLALYAVLTAIALAAGAILGMAWARTVDRAHRQSDLARFEAERMGLESEMSEAKHQIAKIEGSQASERSMHERVRQELQRELATKAEIERQMRPLETAVSKLGESHAEAERLNQKSQTELRERVTGMSQQFSDASRSVSQEARRLSQALSRSEKRGTWGEMQLKRLVESAGMVSHVHFVEQDSKVTANNTRRPDMVVNLGGDRSIVVDSKVSLDAFLSLDNDQDRSEALAAHADAVAAHVKSLSSKAYWEAYNSPEFVVMFLPAEGLLSAALEQKPELLQKSFDSNVILATPTTLLAILRSVSYAWQQESVAKQAKEIHEEGLELHKRLKTMATHFSGLGTSLGRTVDAFNRTLSSMETRVMPSARRFESLTAVREPVETPKEIEQSARTLNPSRWQIEMQSVSEDDLESPDPQETPTLTSIAQEAATAREPGGDKRTA